MVDEMWENPLRREQDSRLPRIAGPCGIVIFGVTGDLARKKLLPAVYDLANRGLLPAGFQLVGFGRRDWDRDEFASYVRSAVEAGARTEIRENVWERLTEGMTFVKGNLNSDEDFDSLASTLDSLRTAHGNWAFYLSVPPSFFDDVCYQLDRSGLAKPENPHSWRRVIIEKPFGHDLASARKLNQTVNSVFPESSVYRIDHYLGKETVQNIVALRFAGVMFEPLWNANYVDHVQITMAEDIGLGGRAGYYDGIGAARDVIQNHLLQLMALVAMEEPTAFSPAALQAEKIKVLSATSPVYPLSATTARGQYTAGWQGSEKVVGLREEEGFDPDSRTETFAACTLAIHSRRWDGVPFFVRTGKRLGRRVTEIAVVFKKAAHMPFEDDDALTSNAVVMRIQPNEGVTMRFGSKVPGQIMEVRDVNMNFSYSESFTEESPEAYERLILDVLLNESSLFPTNEEVELSWKILDPIIEHWAKHGTPEDYPAGTWGPPSADRMMSRTGRAWRLP
ncbi:glucose-6-phosphate dehydrogenase [Corynebacterium pyruviciproducens ATCC BAA-1742]|uniref:Glucose-6-phosphate 1-dehydrogenase n=2 Tax=Corynebacterium pyruviciproducens TaxID=598660 RepID=S2Z0N9_9CORY|nr:glucose-6-phosphate dehydrogenase [Corynebacterium pyruviciproducens ATCC BAA-1742]